MCGPMYIAGKEMTLRGQAKGTSFTLNKSIIEFRRESKHSYVLTITTFYAHCQWKPKRGLKSHRVDIFQMCMFIHALHFHTI